MNETELNTVAAVLANNQGNRLTAELITGIVVTLHRVIDPEPLGEPAPAACATGEAQ